MRGMRLTIALGDTLGEWSAWPAWGSAVASAADREPDAAQVGGIAGDDPVPLILGNPPYAGHSANPGAAIARLLRGVDPLDGGPTGSYFAVDGVPLSERNLKWLNNDYVKFMRHAQWRIERVGQGILAFVTSSGYLDNPTFRGMRRSLMRSFDMIYLLDLHGNGKRREHRHGLRGDTRDESVFNIQQGVAIGLFVRRPGPDGPRREAAVHHAELWGDQARKLAWLAAHDVRDTPWLRLTPHAPLYGFTPREGRQEAEFLRGWPLTTVMPEHSLGVLSKRDALVVGFTPEELLRRVAAFADPVRSDAECASRFDLPLRDNDGWELAKARVALAGEVKAELLRPLLYRPFDTRFVYYDRALIARPNTRILRHLARENVALVVGRQGAATGASSWDIAFATSLLADHNLFRRGGGTVFPMYLHPGDGSASDARTPNLAPQFVAALCSRLGMCWIGDGSGDRVGSVGPEDVLAYIYAVLWAPSFRGRFADFLKSEFPRLPTISDADLFRALCVLGDRLLALHLMRTPAPLRTCHPVSSSTRVERVRYEPAERAGEQGRVWINETHYFDGVAPQVWAFSIGGYRIAEKWLKDRAGRTLTQDELDRYHGVLAALAETQALAQQLDATIARHGGWPLS